MKHKLFSKEIRSFWHATATLVASIIGLGIFGIPFVFTKAGFGLSTIFLVVLTLLAILMYLLYGEIILRTHRRHQILGYIKKYLGRKAYYVGLFNFWISVFGFITAAMIVNGEFLAKTLSFFGITLSSTIATTIMLVIIGYVVFKGLKTLARIDAIVVILFIVLILIIAGFSFPKIDSANYIFTTGEFLFLPFGVLLFALLGTQGIPLTRETLIGKEHLLKKAIIVGASLPALLYLLFTFAVVGVSGQATSPEAIIGLTGHLGSPIVFIGALFGFLASTTIFLSVGTALNESLWQDLKIHKKTAFLAVFIPAYALFLLDTVQFINLIGLVGGVAGSINMILLIMTYVKAKSNGNRIPEYSIRIPNNILYVIIGLLALGALLTLF